jgi:G3E family GTPase
MSGDDRIPLWVSGEPPRVGRQDTVLVVTGDAEPPAGYAAIRHAEAAAVAQQGGCACCSVPSDLVTLLRQLFLERVRGETVFDAVVIAGSPQLAEAAMTDPLVAARYALQAFTRES